MNNIDMIATTVAGVMTVTVVGQASFPSSYTQGQQELPEPSASSCEVSEVETPFVWHLQNSISNETLKRISFVFEKTFFKYDDYAYIRLNKPLHMVFLQGKLSIVDWKAEIDCPGYDKIEQALIRLFQDTYESIAEDTATPAQKDHWLRIIETFDYKFFSHGIAPAIYVEGIVSKIKDGYVSIKWDNGLQNKCAANISVGFTNGRFIENDRIGAYVKWDGYKNLLAIHGVRRISQDKADNFSIGDIQVLANA